MTKRKTASNRLVSSTPSASTVAEIDRLLCLVTAALSQVGLRLATANAEQPCSTSATPGVPAGTQAASANETLDQRGLVRALLLAQHRLEATIKLAIRHYIEAKADLLQIETVAAALRAAAPHDLENALHWETLAGDLVTRGRRQLRHCERTLADLTVEVHEVSAGARLDCDVHRVVRFEETLLPQLDGQVSEVINDYFSWKDEWGQPQLLEAEVVAFRLRAPAGTDSD